MKLPNLTPPHLQITQIRRATRLLNETIFELTSLLGADQPGTEFSYHDTPHNHKEVKEICRIVAGASNLQNKRNKLTIAQ